MNVNVEIYKSFCDFYECCINRSSCCVRCIHYCKITGVSNRKDYFCGFRQSCCMLCANQHDAEKCFDCICLPPLNFDPVQGGAKRG